MFDDIQVAAPSARAGMFDDIPVAASAQRAAAPAAAATGPGFMGYARDIARSVEAGADRGVAGLIGAPADFAGLIASGADWVHAKETGRPYGEVRAEANAKAIVPTDALTPYGGDAIYRGAVEQGRASGYEPQTVPGKYARTAAEFGAQAAVFPGGAARNVIAYGAIPGLASEAAGRATEGTAAEPWARAGAGLVAGFGAGAAASALRPTAAGTVARAVGDLSPVERQAALGRFDGLMAAAKENGIPLSPAFAFDAATNGASDMAGLYRHAEAMGRMRGFNAQMPGAVEQAGRAQFDRMAPIDMAPTQLGGRVADAAQGALNAMPEGIALTEARQAAGPRVTPYQAGQTIQGDLRGVQDAREAVRIADAARDYSAARAAPENVGIERMIAVERPGEPVLQTIDPGKPLAPSFPHDGPSTLDSLKPRNVVGPDAGDPGRGNGKSLARFMAENGGIGLERGDVTAAGLDKLRQPGVAKLVRQDGLSIDNHWRERLIEEGYLPPDHDGGMQRSVHDELIGLLQEEHAGRKVYPYDWVGREDGSGLSARREEFSAASDMATTRLSQALRSSGIDPNKVHPEIRDRAAAMMLRDGSLDPADAYERTVMAMREPPSRGPTMREVPTTVQEQIPDVRFGQVDPRPALAAVQEQARTAKGDVRGALSSVRGDLYEPGGQNLDTSVTGLLHARERLDFQIRSAQEVSDATKVRDLTIPRNALDGQLKRVPEVATADRNFAANSRPLEPFAGDAPLGRVTRQDPLTGRMATPAEQVPGLLSGPTAAGEALANGSPVAREAMQQRLVTQIIDGATDARGGVSAEGVRRAMREHEDVLAQMPDAAARLNRVAQAQEGLDGLRGTLVGRLAERDLTTARAVSTLFPKGGDLLANGEREIGAAVKALAQQNPTAARQVVRAKAENLFNSATKDVQPGANQMGGAKYAAQIVGNPQEAANLNAAVRALPDGDVIADGFGRFLDVLKASGRRQNVGSRTAYNEEFLRETREGGKIEGVARTAAGGFLKLPAKIQEKFERWRLGRNLDEFARLFSDPDAIGAFRGLVAAGDRGGDIRGPVARLVAIASREAQQRSGERRRQPMSERP